MNQPITTSMNFSKIKFQVHLISVFCLAVLQFVEASLPNEDRLRTIPCVRDFFREEFLGKSFESPIDRLTDGEYLGELCDNLSEEDFKKAIKREVCDTFPMSEQGFCDYDGKLIKKCLSRSDNETLFEKYRKLGASLSQHHSQSDPDTQKSENLSAASEVHQNTPSENSDLLSSQIFHFVQGICGSKEEVEFEQVEGDEDITETLSCLADCTGRFLQRIENNLVIGKAGAIALLNAEIKIADSNKNDQKITEEKTRKKKLKARIDHLTNNAKIAKLAISFAEAYERSTEVKSIEFMEKLGKDYLNNYSKFYYLVNHDVGNSDKQSYDGIGNLDNNLYATFSMYQNCSKIGCGMTLNSTPFYKLIQEGAKPPNQNVPTISPGFIKLKLEERGWYTPKNRAFFQAFVRIRPTVPQTKINDSKSSLN